MKSVRITDRKRRRQGAVLVWVVVTLGVLVSVVAMNLDGGRMMDERRKAQNAADAAALAAGDALYTKYWTYHGLDTNGAARAAALEIAAANGYPASAVTVNIPPTSGTFAGQAGHVEVSIDTSLEAGFGKIFTGNNLNVSARSVARGQPLKIGIILLRSSGANAFLSQSVIFSLVNKPLIVNSSDPGAFRQDSIGVFLAERIDITGGISAMNLSLLPPRIRTGVRPTLDPLAFLPVPDTSGPVRSSTPLTIDSLLPTILRPGVYRGGIRIRGLSIVTMLPGVYVMEGGGFRVEDVATVLGLETVIYNTTSSTYASGPFSVSGLGKVVLTAPLSGTYQGINLFQHRGMTEPVSITGLGLTTITGTVYAASAPATITGSAAVGLDILGGAFVVDSMLVRGVGAVTINLGLNPPRVPEIRVVE